MGAQRRFRLACAFTQSDRNHHRAHFGYTRIQRFYMRRTKTPIRLRGCACCIGSFLGTHVRKYVFAYCASRKHMILTPLNATFIKKNLGLQEYTLFFLFLLRNIDCGYWLEPPRRGGSNEYQQSMFLRSYMKNIRVFFLSENFQFLEVKISIYLYRRVIVTDSFIRTYKTILRTVKQTLCTAAW